MILDDVFLFLSALIVRLSSSMVVKIVPVYLAAIAVLFRFPLASFSVSKAFVFVDEVGVIRICIDDLRALEIIKIAALLLDSSFVSRCPGVPSTYVSTRLATRLATIWSGGELLIFRKAEERVLDVS